MLFDLFPMHLRSGMHRQLGALREMVAALDPELHALLAARDATNYFFCYRWCGRLTSHCPTAIKL
jgi:hypothetical protein